MKLLSELPSFYDLVLGEFTHLPFPNCLFLFFLYIGKNFQPLMLNVLQCLLFSHNEIFGSDRDATQRKGASGTYKQRKFKQYNLTVPLLWRLRAPLCKSNLFRKAEIMTR